MKLLAGNYLKNFSWNISKKFWRKIIWNFRAGNIKKFRRENDLYLDHTAREDSSCSSLQFLRQCCPPTASCISIHIFLFFNHLSECPAPDLFKPQKNVWYRVICIATVGRAITIWRAIHKRSHVWMYKSNTKSKAKRLRAITFAITKFWRATTKSKAILEN